MQTMERKMFDYYSNVRQRKVDWLWFPYIPYGKVTMLQGDPGDGKSTFILQIVSLLSKGLPMPDGYRVKESQNIIYQCSEDDLADTVKPRLIAAGADCVRIAFIVDNDERLTLEDERIEKTLEATKARLLIIDPIQAYLTHDYDMQNAIRIPIKSSLAPEGCAIAFSLSREAGFQWDGLRSVDVDRLLSEESDYGNKLTLACKYLDEMLNAQDTASNAVYDKMQRMGIGKRTVANAKQKIHIISYRKNGAWYWKLPTTPDKETQTTGGNADE